MVPSQLMSRKRKKTADSQPVTSLRDWRDDWLYLLVLRDAEETWAHRKREMQMIDNADESAHWKYVLVEEYGSSEDSMCRGDVLRAWTVDDNGLAEIPLDEHVLHIQEIEQRIYPFILMQFHIHPNRKNVVLGHVEASTAGSGCVYRVQGHGSNAQLLSDESFGFWVS